MSNQPVVINEQERQQQALKSSLNQVLTVARDVDCPADIRVAMCADIATAALASPAPTVAPRATAEEQKEQEVTRVDTRTDADLPATTAPTALPDSAAARSAAVMLNSARLSHSEAVADCLHCNARFLAGWALKLLGPEPERVPPPGPPDPPRRGPRATPQV